MGVDGGNHDEFDAYFGDDFDDESLAQVELLASQQHQPPPPTTTSIQTSVPSTSRAGHFVNQHAPRIVKQSAHNGGSVLNGHHHQSQSQTAHGHRLGLSRPAKRQKLDLVPSQTIESPPRPQHQAHHQQHQRHHNYPHPTPGSNRRRAPPPDNDFEVVHDGPGRPPALGAGHGETLNKDHFWSDNDWEANGADELSLAEQEASMLTASQQHPPMQKDNNDKRKSSDSAQTNARNPGQPEQFTTAPPIPRQNHIESDTEMQAALMALRKEKEAMEAQLKAALADVRERTNRMYARDGEIRIVRERNERAEKDLAELRATLQKSKEDFSKQLEDQERTFAAEKEKLDTNAAFNRLEAETSAKRIAWPGSVRRRMPRNAAGGGFAASQYAPSQNTFAETFQGAAAPPPVAPTTPTRRGNRRQHQFTPSPSRSGGARGSRNDLDAMQMELLQESPSKDTSLRRIAPLRLPGPTPKKTPGFAGFDNSFSTTANLASAPRQHPDIRNTVTAIESAKQSQPSEDEDPKAQSSGHQKPKVHNLLDALRVSRRERFVWAVAGLYRRRTSLLAALLTHTSPRPQAPLSLPCSRCVEERIDSPKLLPDHTSTLHRLLNTQLPAHIVPAIKRRQTAANEILLEALRNGASNHDGERRFGYLLHSSEDEVTPKDANELTKVEEADYWECEEILADGMQELWDDIASALRILMGMYLRLCMMDAFQDVISLMTSIAVIEPQIINSFLTEQIRFEEEAEDVEPDASGDDEQEESQSVAGTQRSKAHRASHSTSVPPFPDQIESCLMEAVKKCSGLLPLHVSSPESAVLETEVANTQPAATQPRASRVKVKKADELESRKAWDMGANQSEAVLQSVLGLLEVLVWHMEHQVGRYLKSMFEAPGFLMTFLDSHRSPVTMERFLSILTLLVQYKDMWKCLVACQVDGLVHKELPHLITRSRTPLLEVLAKHLVDLRHRHDATKAHDVHCSIITFLSQLVLKHEDALTISRESKSLFAALIQNIHTDTNAIWTDDGSSIFQHERSAYDVVSRIVMNVRLVAFIFTPLTPLTNARIKPTSQDLISRLNNHENHLLLNGISHCFILSFNRLAFANEPTWMDEGCVNKLQEIVELASDLVELVLSPDDVEDAWLVCGDDDDEEQGEVQEDQMKESRVNATQEAEEDEEEELVASTAYPAVAAVTSTTRNNKNQVESFTQSQENL